VSVAGTVKITRTGKGEIFDSLPQPIAGQPGTHLVRAATLTLEDSIVLIIHAVDIVAPAADHPVGTKAGNQEIIATAADERISPALTDQGIVAASAIQYVGAFTALQNVVATLSAQQIVAPLATQQIVAAPAEHEVVER
jgi:hypothetical protein